MRDYKTELTKLFEDGPTPNGEKFDGQVLNDILDDMFGEIDTLRRWKDGALEVEKMHGSINDDEFRNHPLAVLGGMWPDFARALIASHKQAVSHAESKDESYNMMSEMMNAAKDERDETKAENETLRNAAIKDRVRIEALEGKA